MNDEEKVQAILSCLTHGLLQYGTFDEMRSWVGLAEKIADLIDKRQRVQHRQEIDRRLMQAWGPTVCN